MKRILFVDDEAPILDGIRAMLHRRRGEWEMDFCESGVTALAALEKQPYDLICCDMRMPGMDGAQLLTLVSVRWPQTVRIVLSGYSQLTQAIRMVPIAHQYLSKPCQPNQFDNILERCLRVQELLTRPTLRAVVGRVRKLPALPRTYAKLREVMAKPNVATGEVAKVVAADMAIAAKVLQVVNSSFFRLARSIGKIEQAVSYLGFAAVRNLVMSVEVFSQWTKTNAVSGLDLESMQNEALQTGALARELAAGTAIADDALVAGLLHDIGYLVLVAECPKELQQAKRESLEKNIPMYQAERNIIGASHAEVGAYLLALWGLPYSIVEAVAQHHEPHAVAQTEFDLLSAVVIAEALLRKPDQPSALDADHQIDAAYLQTIHAPFTWEHAQQRAQAITATGQTP